MIRRPSELDASVDAGRADDDTHQAAELAAMILDLGKTVSIGA